MITADHLGQNAGFGLDIDHPPSPETGEKPPEIRIGKTWVPAEVNGAATTAEIFTMTLGEETILLLPLKTWSQLDTFKWRVQGKLPGTPAGLEVTAEHVKMAGEDVWVKDPEGCATLERVFNEWLALQRGALEQAKQKVQAAPAQEPVAPAEEEPMHFEVEFDKAGQPHIRCVEGKETVANVALTVPGLTSLMTQGLMRKPGAWKIGALRDWVELDGQIFKFNDGEKGLRDLQAALNERYHPVTEPGSTRDVAVFANPASASGFDIQFPAAVNGLTENRRRHLDPDTMELLSDPQKCRVLRKGIVVKFTPPTFIFKQKMSDGGERTLEAGVENTVWVSGEGGQQKAIDLSQPVSHLGLGVTELAEIFNHPAINRRARRSE